MSNYRKEVERTQPVLEMQAMPEVYGAIGLAGEAGEVTDLIKKIFFHDKEMTDEVREQLKLELGDVRWYLEYLALQFGFTMQEIEQANVDKLRKRYPAGGPTRKGVTRDSA